MAISDIVASIDHELSLLKQARAVLSGLSSPAKKATKGNKLQAAAIQAGPKASPLPKKTKRNLTPEGRKRIAEAVKRRWAKQRKLNSAK